MVLTTHRAKSRDRPAPETAASLLAELEQAHDALAQAMAELDRMTRQPEPDKRLFTAARWRISRASLTRRLLWAKILGFLLGRAGERSASELRRLQDRDIELLRTSIRHVAEWTTPAALAHWPVYCEASRIIRAKMRAAIEAERKLLNPMLRKVIRGEDLA